MFFKATREFLGPDLKQQLLDYISANQHRLKPSTVGTGRHDTSARLSRLMHDLGPLRHVLESRVLALVPGLIIDLGLTPFEPTDVELEIAVHGDGGFYTRHIDLFTGKTRSEHQTHDRLISMVYYCYNEPKGFSGGALRLFTNHANLESGVVDIEPQQDTIVAFSSWLPHEVRPVACPSGLFHDSRFSVNCWVSRVHSTIQP
jgi:SM-20-related protein